MEKDASLKGAGRTISISHNEYFRAKNSITDRDDHFIKKRPVHQGNIIVLHVYASNNGASWYMKRKLREWQSETNSVILGTFNIPLSIIYKTSRQKISKDIVDLNKDINQLDLTDM